MQCLLVKGEKNAANNLPHSSTLFRPVDLFLQGNLSTKLSNASDHSETLLNSKKKSLGRSGKTHYERGPSHVLGSLYLTKRNQ